MELWKQVDWKHRPERKTVTTFARMFRVKLRKAQTLEDIAPLLSRSRYWIEFDPERYIFASINNLLQHLVETYGLEVVLKEDSLHNIGSELSWPLPSDVAQAAAAMAALKQAEPRLEPRPFVRNGSSDIQSWAVFSSSDWAELEAAGLYTVRALFPMNGKVPDMPPRPRAEAPRRQRDPSHEALLTWVSANNEQMVSRLVEALDKLETSHPDSQEERDAINQIYRIERRARR
jgi:hypothetical protein